MVGLPTWTLLLLFSLGRQKWSAENPTGLNRSFNNLQSYQAQRCPSFWGRSWIPARFLSEVNRRILQSPEELLTYEDSEAESEKKGGFFGFIRELITLPETNMAPKIFGLSKKKRSHSKISVFRCFLLLVSGRVYGVKRPLDRSSLLGILSLTESLTKQDFKGRCWCGSPSFWWWWWCPWLKRTEAMDFQITLGNPLLRGRTSWFSGGITFSVLGL